MLVVEKVKQFRVAPRVPPGVEAFGRRPPSKILRFILRRSAETPLRPARKIT